MSKATDRKAAMLDAQRLLGKLRVGDTVIITEDCEDLELTVQHTLRTSPGGGSWEHANVTVGYGPGRYNTSVSPASIAEGYTKLRLK